MNLQCVDLDLARSLDIEMNLVSTHPKINDKYMKENSYLPDNLLSNCSIKVIGKVSVKPRPFTALVYLIRLVPGCRKMLPLLANANYFPTWIKFSIF